MEKLKGLLGVAGLKRRVAELEAEVQENRQLNLRIAELCDVVAELLVPLEERDADRVRAVLDRYREDVSGANRTL